MVSSEVQRTLVKSPPELWAELSDPAALARHLGELGEIRIVRTEPESTIEWEAEDLTGTVSIKPSGWGTKVTLTVTRDEPQAPPEPKPEPADPTAEATSRDSPSGVTADACAPANADMQPIAASTHAPEPGFAELVASSQPDAEPEVLPESAARPEASPEPAASATAAPEASPEPGADPPQPPLRTDLAAPEEPKRSFFARLFGRGRRHRATAHEPEAHETLEASLSNEAAQAAPQPASHERPERPPIPSDAFAAVSEMLAPQTLLSSSPFAGEPTVTVTAAATGLSAELKAAEEIAADDVTAVLTAVLDRLGAAHHRPFSRA
jgi:hypothetical protein